MASRIVQQMLGDARSATTTTNGHGDSVVPAVVRAAAEPEPAPESDGPAEPAVFDAGAAAGSARDGEGSSGGSM